MRPAIAAAMLPSQDTVSVTLKWFNSPKGFGFVVLEDRQRGYQTDAFLHITTLQRAGIDALGEGACLLCRLEEGPKGAQVLDVVQLLDAGVDPEPVQCDPVNRVNYHDSPVQRVAGIVKWYKPEKGFGFVVADDGEKDIFLHRSCLAPHGLSDICPGTRLLMDIQTVPKGREVVGFAFID